MLVTVADLADAFGSDIDMEDPRAVQILAGVDAEVKSYCGQKLEQVAAELVNVPGFGETVTLDGGTKILLLPEFPVTAVGLVTESGVDLTQGPEDDYVWDRSGLLVRMGTDWAGGYRTVEVSYDHGYQPIPADVKSVVLSAALRAWSEALAGQSADYPERSGIALNDEERRILDRGYRDRRIR